MIHFCFVNSEGDKKAIKINAKHPLKYLLYKNKIIIDLIIRKY